MIDDVLTIVQVAFYTIAATVTILTYIHAKRSILVPFRTETFKAQLDDLRALSEAFGQKSESLLEADLDWHNVVVGSIALEFMNHFGRQDRSRIPDSVKYALPSEFEKGMWFDPDALIPEGDQYFSVDYTALKAGDRVLLPTTVVALLNNDTDEELILTSGRVGILCLTPKFIAYLEELAVLPMRPLMPESLQVKVNEYRNLVLQNLHTLQIALDDIHDELEAQYPNTCSVDRVAIQWAIARVRRSFKPLEPKSRDIIDEAKLYFSMSK